ncbi:MAG TPA: YkgJ family cysteine cluster protein [Vicinamibacterales bacterium]|nr:YkgJ family cysteine cluster protein [Vicinamibacterales bacterium]
MSSPNVFALSIHADYACRHSGACCSADWDVPVELPVYRSLDEAITSGRVRPQAAARHLSPFVVEPDLPEGAAAMLERTDAGECVFLEHETKLCIVHRDMGEAALPATCRHFPRLAVRDERGTFITLSHFCPTAASMLFRDDCALAIVAGPRAFPPLDYEGLTVTTNDLPPLLSPTMLMDLAGYSAWEYHMVARCAETGMSPESVVETLTRDARLLRNWRPGGITLVDAVRTLPDRPERTDATGTVEASVTLFEQVMRAVPDDLRPPPDESGLDSAFAHFVSPAWSTFHAPLNRYLAAKAFASWTAYQGRGIMTIVRGLDAALSVVRLESARQCRNARRALDARLLRDAFRRADFILNHLAVAEELAEAWSLAES